MARKTISVYRRGDSWVAKKPENDRPSAVRDNQKEAYLAAKRIALREGRSITVYYSSRQKRVITPKDDSDDDCFITTACVKYLRLPDDCYELSTLRKFRDNYLLKSSEGNQLVLKYYEVAPFLVSKIESDHLRDAIYKEVFEQIQYACHLIEHSNFIEATKVYKNVVKGLCVKYKF